MGDRIAPFSVILPAYNERGNIASLAARLAPILAQYGAEAILVDDGSSDGTLQAAAGTGLFRCVSILHSGKTAALRAGFQAARHALVVTIDADLQEDPTDIPRFVSALAAADLVHGCRLKRADGLVSKIWPSWFYNWMIAIMFGRHFGDINCGLRAMHRDLALSLPFYEGAHRLYPLFVHRRGGHVARLVVAHSHRRAGRAKYSSPVRFAGAIFDLLRIGVLNHAD